MSYVTIIPAKANSSRIPHKNFREIYNRSSLVDITLKHATNLQDQSLCILSTDHSSYSLRGYDERYQLHIRPDNLSTRDSSILSLLHSIVIEYDISPSTNILLLQPTSPFRTHAELADINNLALSLNSSSLFSGYISTDAHPFRMYKPVASISANPFNVTPWHQDLTSQSIQAQHLPSCIHRDGAFYLFSAADIHSSRLYNENVLCYVRPQALSINIDEPIDFLIAESLIRLTSCCAETLLEICGL